MGYWLVLRLNVKDLGMREYIRTGRMFGGQIVVMVPALVSPPNPPEPSFLYIHITGNPTYTSATNWPLEAKTFSVLLPPFIQMFPRFVSAPFPWKYSCRGRIPGGHTSACPVSAMFPTMLSVFCSHVQDPVLHQTKRLLKIFLPGEFSGDFQAWFICWWFFHLFPQISCNTHI